MANSLVLRVREALTKVALPGGRADILTSGAVRGLQADESGRVSFTIEVPAALAPSANDILKDAKEAASSVDGVTAVSAVVTAHQSQGTAVGGHDNPLGMPRTAARQNETNVLPNVKNVIAVASGKGGVGKSTVAANLAMTFADMGLKTGLLDADVYGPSAPTLFGLNEKAKMADGKIIPFERYGVRVMSIGFLVDEQQALAWRGPMVMGAVRQLMNDVDWGELDILIIDTPPGTGDTQLSLIQSKKLCGAIIVSTPQQMALADVRRGVSLFRKTEIPVLGVIENMAWLETPSGERQHIFGNSGAVAAAQDLDAPFLGSVPLVPDLRAACDTGSRLDDQHPLRRTFQEIAKKILASLG